MINKKTIKEFLKLSWVKILLLIVFVIFFASVNYHGVNCYYAWGGGCDHIRGFPFAIHSVHYPASTNLLGPLPVVSHTPIFMLPNIIFWYLISCMTVGIYKKVNSKTVK